MEGGRGKEGREKGHRQATSSPTASHTTGSRKHLNSIIPPEYNMALLGAMGVGKSALTVKYITRRYIMEYDPYLEDTYTKSENMDGQDITVRIMDTCDQEDSNPDRYLQWANGFIVVYSITDLSSFEKAKTYLESISQYQRITGKDMPTALVGNKVDLECYRMVSASTGKTLAAQYEGTLYETSAAECFEGVEMVFHDMIRDIKRLRESQMPLQPLFISEDKSALLGSMPHGRHNTFRRAKSPKAPDLKDQKDKRDEKDPKVLQKRTVSSFKFFNKSFKIFN